MKRSFLSAIIIVLFCISAATAQKIPTPKDVLGFTPGEDRKLASWAKTVEYFQKLAQSSDRVTFHEPGQSTMGKPFIFVTISSPENLKNIDKYREINDKLADPRLIKSSDKEAQKLIKQGKTIVLKTFGVHSTEVGSYLSSMLIAHELASSSEPRIKKILDETIILIVPALSPDGVDIVKDWYDKTLGTPYEGTSPPELYHKYVGHDLNRDWYAFTQVETQLTVKYLHNYWHPQIVHDVHQQGSHGARYFVPPYMEPVEPNVPKQIVEGYTELGNHIAKDMRAKDFQGLTTGTTYDAWTPARAYSHYHGGVRILSETASAKLATPITVKAEDLRGGRGVNPHKDDANNGPAWKGGEWRLQDITNYMTTGAFSLLDHAAENRERWLTRFYEIGKEAVRTRKDGELYGFIIPRRSITDNLTTRFIPEVLESANVETIYVERFMFEGETYEKGSLIVPLAQPHGSFARTLLEKQIYPDLKDNDGNPIPPYDVTAHTISLLAGIEVIPIYSRPPTKVPKIYTSNSEPHPACISDTHEIQIYKSSIASMDEGWTRFVAANETTNRHGFLRPCERLSYSSLTNVEIRDGKIKANIKNGNQERVGSVIFPDQSPNHILNGYSKGSMPDEYVGGVGKEGVENLKKFVEAGGTLVFLNRASNFAIEHFELPIKDVTKGVDRKDLYIPGSILRTELNTGHRIAKDMPESSIAWFEHSPVFEVGTQGSDDAGDDRNRRFGNMVSVQPGRPTIEVQVVARYPSDAKDILLSGWALGTEKLAGKAALVEVKYGKGKLVLFGFRPQYRGQSLATFPLLFNSLN